MSDVCIDKKQADEIAGAIINDIHTFIENHKEEYEAFVKAEMANT